MIFGLVNKWLRDRAFCEGRYPLMNRVLGPMLFLVLERAKALCQLLNSKDCPPGVQLFRRAHISVKLAFFATY